MSENVFGQCATLIGHAAIPKSLMVVPTPTNADTGKVFTAGEDGAVEWKELKVPSQTVAKIENLDKTNKFPLRSLESGSYILHGYFTPYEGGDSTMVFTDNILVNALKSNTESHIQIFYPYNNCVQYLKITDTTYERKNIYLNNLVSVGDMPTSLPNPNALVINFGGTTVTYDGSSAQAVTIPTYEGAVE